MRLRRRTRRLGIITLIFLLSAAALAAMIDAMSTRDALFEHGQAGASNNATATNDSHHIKHLAAGASRAWTALASFGDDAATFAIESPDDDAGLLALEADLEGRHPGSSLDVVFATHARGKHDDAAVRTSGFRALGVSGGGRGGMGSPSFSPAGFGGTTTPGGSQVPAAGGISQPGNAATDNTAPTQGGIPANGGNGTDNPGKGAIIDTPKANDPVKGDVNDNGTTPGAGTGPVNGNGPVKGDTQENGTAPGAGNGSQVNGPGQGVTPDRGNPPAGGQPSDQNGNGNGNGNANLTPEGNPGVKAPEQSLPPRSGDVPEPASIAILLTGLGLIGVARRRKAA